jgi:hypothetical protein
MNDWPAEVEAGDVETRQTPNRQHHEDQEHKPDSWPLPSLVPHPFLLNPKIGV